MPVVLPPPRENITDRQIKNHTPIIILQAVILAAVCVLLWFVLVSDSEHQNSTGLPAKQIRSIASKLKAAGALEESCRIYENYLTQTKLNDTERASLSFSLGNLYLEQGRYEKALRWFYEAEMSGAQELKEELGKKIVHSLEAMGRVHAAKAVLERHTSLSQPEPEHSAQDPVVAKIGNHQIFRSDVTMALDDLPPYIKQHFAGPKGSVEFLKKFVADELIFKKAKKLEIDKDPDVTRAFEVMLKQLVVNRFIETQIFEKLKVDSADLHNYYTANREKYDEPDSAKIRLIMVANQEEAKKLKEKIRKGTSFESLARKHSLHSGTKDRGGLIDGYIKKGESFLGTMNESDLKAVSDAVFSIATGQVSDPIYAADNCYLFKVEELRKGKKRSFEEAQKQVETDYRIMKTQTTYSKLIQETLSAEDVELFPNHMQEPKSNNTADQK